MSMRRALGTVSHSQANTRQDGMPSRVNKKSLGGRQSVGLGRKSVGSRQSLAPPPSSSRKSTGGRQSVGGGRQSVGGGRQSIGASRRSVGGRQSMGASLSGRQSIGGRPSLGRSSLGGTSRRSSIHSAATATTDPRNLSDSAFRNSVIQQLTEFLVSNGYGYPISPKLLSSPSDSDVFRIFQFLYHHIDPNFKFAPISGAQRRKSMAGNRDATIRANETMVDQIPTLLKHLAYPFKINRSTVISCGSGSNWPKMLGALHFLLQIVSIRQNVDIDSQIFGEGGTGNGFEEDQAASQHNQLMFEYLQEAYRAFLTGDDDLKAQLDDDMLSSFQEDNDKIRESKEQLVDANDRLALELEQLESSPNPQDVLVKNKKLFEDDVSKFQVLIERLGVHKQKMMAKLSEVKLELERRKEESASFDVEKERMQGVYDRQELTQADVQRMKTARSKLDDQMTSIQKRKEEMDQRAWKQEVVLSKKLEGIDKAVSSFNKLAEQLQLLPRESQLAGGMDFEIRMNPHATEPGQSLLDTDLQGSLMPNIGELKDRITNSVYQIREQQLGHIEQVKKIKELVKDKSDNVASLRKKLELNETQYQNQKAILDDKHKQNMGNIEGLQEEILQIQKGISQENAESARLLEKANTEFMTRKEELQREKDAFENTVVQSLEIVTRHKAQIQEFIGEYKKTIQEVSK